MTFQQEMEEEKKDPDFVFHMDGSPHYKSETGCCRQFGKDCTNMNCDGFMHYQPVYGGYYYKCEKCNKEDI